VNATIDGVVLEPSALVITSGEPPSITETQELVVPKSIPIILPILLSFVFVNFQFFVVMSHISGHNVLINIIYVLKCMAKFLCQVFVNTLLS
jgi:hypothetical protein